jgi:hypothetical protein
MKIAIGLFGIYSKYYKKNNYKGDIFTLSYKDCFEEDKQIVSRDYINNSILNLTNIELINKQFNNKHKCIEYILNMIHIHENKNNIKYDIIVLATFRDIVLNFPTDSGIYRTSYYGETKFIPYTIIESIEIISDLYIRVNGASVINIYASEHDIFQKLLNILFDNKVIQPSFITQNNDVSICIPSVINTSNSSFNYVSYRSIFTHNERFEHTLSQVKSINNINIYSKITTYLLEGSQLDLNQMDILSKYCNIILFCCDDKAFLYANTCLNKSLYEVWCMKYVLQKTMSKWIFKFGGRYTLHDFFNITDFLKDKPVFKVINAQNTFSKNESIIECIIYSIPQSYFNSYVNIYNNILEYITDSYGSIESLLYKYAEPDMYTIEYLNVYGRDAIEGFDNLV